MPVFQLTEDLVFPPPHLAEPDGLLAVGGDLRVDRLLLAYRMGIFPWYSQDTPILWWSPDPRFVLFPRDLHVSRSLAKDLRREWFTVAMDTAFDRVIAACAAKPRPGQDGTWITEEMMGAYCALHEAGYAHSIETYCEGELVGGLYGVQLGACFFGESMFSDVSNASKVALVSLAERVRSWGAHAFIDCQVPTPHLERMGAKTVSRVAFLKQLELGCPSIPPAEAWDCPPERT